MSATEKLQEHPVFKQAKSKAEYYYSQLDKEVSFRIHPRGAVVLIMA